MQYSPIEWTHFTANPLRYRDPDGNVVHACIHKSTGCLHCYAETLAGRWGRAGKKFTAENMKSLTPFLDENELKRMLTYKPAAGKMCFIGDMTDIFGEWVPFELLDRLFAVFAMRPDVIWQVLTKRADRMREYFNRPDVYKQVLGRMFERASVVTLVWPLPNCWLGVSAENQQYANERIPLLLQTPAAKRFVSYEPALGPVDFTSVRHSETIENIKPGEHLTINLRINALNGDWFDGWDGGNEPERKLDWIIVGGESGPGARPFHVRWAGDVVRQCKAAGTACFVKQLGGSPMEHPSQIREWPPESQRRFKCLDTVGPLVKMTLQDRKGGDMAEWPDDLRVRQFPPIVETRRAVYEDLLKNGLKKLDRL